MTSTLDDLLLTTIDLKSENMPGNGHGKGQKCFQEIDDQIGRVRSPKSKVWRRPDICYENDKPNKWNESIQHQVDYYS